MDSTDSQAIDTIDLSALLRPLLSRWKLLLVCMLLGGGIGFAISRAQPKVYQSTATIYVKPNGGASALLQSLPINLGSGSGTSSGYYVTLLQSDSTLREVITKLNLLHRRVFTRGKRVSMEKALRRMRSDVTVKETKSGGINIVTRAHSPYVARDIGREMLRILDARVETRSGSKVEFISAKLKETSRQLEKAEDEMGKFMQQYSIAEVGAQTKAMIDQVSVLDGQLLALDVEREQLRSRLTNSGELDMLVNGEVRAKEVESSRGYLIRKRDELQRKIDALPMIGIKYARLQREIAVLSKTYEILTQQYQLERITQHGEDGDYQIVDRPVPVMRKVAPRGSAYAAVGAMLGFMAAALLALHSAPAQKYKKH